MPPKKGAKKQKTDAPNEEQPPATVAEPEPIQSRVLRSKMKRKLDTVDANEQGSSKPKVPKKTNKKTTDEEAVRETNTEEEPQDGDNAAASTKSKAPKKTNKKVTDEKAVRETNTEEEPQNGDNAAASTKSKAPKKTNKKVTEKVVSKTNSEETEKEPQNDDVSVVSTKSKAPKKTNKKVAEEEPQNGDNSAATTKSRPPKKTTTKATEEESQNGDNSAASTKAKPPKKTTKKVTEEEPQNDDNSAASTKPKTVKKTNKKAISPINSDKTEEEPQNDDTSSTEASKKTNDEQVASETNKNTEEEPQNGDTAAPSTIYEFKANTIDGKEVSLDTYKGHVCIIVNVASKCGHTAAHYKELVEMHQKYGEEKGLKILAFPCNQFGKQEPGDSNKICEFVKKKNVEFDMFEKIEVNGKKAHPLWKFLCGEIEGPKGAKIDWNFTKFLVDKEGKVVGRFKPGIKPSGLVPELEKLW